jgi:hypothetical protein
MYALQFLHTFDTMVKAYFQTFYKLSSSVQTYKRAHCITSSFFNHSTPVSSSRFRSGSSFREIGGTVHPAAQIVQHPLYDWWTLDFDISVVRVSFVLDYTFNNSVIVDWGPVPHFFPLEALQPVWQMPEVYCCIPRISNCFYCGSQVPLASTNRGSFLAARGGTMGKNWWPADV